ncbi:MAG: trigger factor [Candidatus Magasanikbacteria bacterium]|jgi:trigger factor
MQHTLKQLPKSQVELIITVTLEDYKKDMETAALRISQRAAIHGFRPGKAPYDIVKQNVGEIKILEEAMQTIVEKNYHSAVVAEKLETIGMPEITIEKMAPGNDFVFKAVAALLPTVKLGDTEKIKVEKKEIKVEDKQIDEVIENLKKMQGKEVVKEGVATKEDKVEVAMNMSINKVPVEGGQAPKHQVYLSEPHYIPGFAEQLVGLKKDDTKEFSLRFPDEHYQKHLAGKDVDISIKVNDVYSIEYPEISDELAQKLGQKSVEGLKEILMTNLKQEAQNKEDQRIEAELLEKVILASEFSEVPDVLIKSEKQKMFYELKNSLQDQGIEFEKYLKDLKKTEEEIAEDFAERALTRVKAALISRQIAKENDIKVEKEELDKEIEVIKITYKNDPKVDEALKRQEVLDTLAATIQNKKVVQWLKEKILK